MCPENKNVFSDPTLAEIAGVDAEAPPPSLKQYVLDNPGVRGLMKIKSKREKTLNVIRKKTGNPRVSYGSVMTTLSEVHPVRAAKFHSGADNASSAANGGRTHDTLNVDDGHAIATTSRPVAEPPPQMATPSKKSPPTRGSATSSTQPARREIDPEDYVE